MRVELDGTTLRTEGDIHDQLARALDFGPYYGRNLDALWDRLTTDVELPVELVWKDSAASVESMGEESFTRIRAVLLDVQARDESRGRANRFTVRFE